MYDNSLALEGNPSQVKKHELWKVFPSYSVLETLEGKFSNYMLKKLEGKSFHFHDQRIWKGYPFIFMIKNLKGKSFQMMKIFWKGNPSIFYINFGRETRLDLILGYRIYNDLCFKI